MCALTQPDFQLIAMLACKHETCPALVALWLGNCNARVPVWTRRRLKPSAFPGVDRLLISVNTSPASDPVLVAWLLMLLTIVSWRCEDSIWRRRVAVRDDCLP